MHYIKKHVGHAVSTEIECEEYWLSPSDKVWGDKIIPQSAGTLGKFTMPKAWTQPAKDS